MGNPQGQDDPAVFEAYWARERDRIYRALALTLGDAALASEAVDEAMVRTLERWSTVGRYTSPAGWTYRVAFNWATSWRRKLVLRPTRPAEHLDQPVRDDVPDLDLAGELADDAIWLSPVSEAADEAVYAFAHDVLGWPEATIEIEDRFGPPGFQITGPHERTVVGQLGGSGTEGVWALLSLRTPLGTQQLGPWAVGFRPPPGTAAATAYVHADQQTWPVSLGTDELAAGRLVPSEHGVPAAAEVRSALLVYRDADGVTIRADGGRFGIVPDEDEHAAVEEPVGGGIAVGPIDGVAPPQDLRVEVTDGEVCFPTFAGNCAAQPRAGNLLGGRYWSQEGRPDARGCAFGGVDASVHVLELEFHDVTTRRVPTLANEQLGDQRVYATCWSGELRVETRRGFDAEGRMVATD